MPMHGGAFVTHAAAIKQVGGHVVEDHQNHRCSVGSHAAVVLVQAHVWTQCTPFSNCQCWRVSARRRWAAGFYRSNDANRSCSVAQQGVATGVKPGTRANSLPRSRPNWAMAYKLRAPASMATHVSVNVAYRGSAVPRPAADPRFDRILRTETKVMT